MMYTEMLNSVIADVFFYNLKRYVLFLLETLNSKINLNLLNVKLFMFKISSNYYKSDATKRI